METIKLIRSFQDAELATPGVLLGANGPICATLERPWMGNQQCISCIPLGKYTCKFVTNRQTAGGMAIPKTYEVLDVPDRDGILFHVGNYVHETRGCILVGNSIFYGQNTQVLASKAGFKDFIGIMADKDFIMEVVCAS